MNRDDTKHRRGGEGRGGRVGEEEEGEARMRRGRRGGPTAQEEEGEEERGIGMERRRRRMRQMGE